MLSYVTTELKGIFGFYKKFVKAFFLTAPSARIFDMIQRYQSATVPRAE